MKVLISGATGLVGSALIDYLRARNFEVFRLVRKDSALDCDIHWNPVDETFDIEKLRRVKPEFIVHLAGENVLGIWTQSKKDSIRDSRVKGTEFLAQSILKACEDGAWKPRAFISASGITVYGNQGDEILTEKSECKIGDSFLAQVVVDWENASKVLEPAGIRVAHLRIGFVLTRDGGGLGSMLPAFKMGLGGVMGTGKQWLPWISFRDLLGAFEHVMNHEEINGPVNTIAVSSTNYDFTKTLGGVLWRPTLCWMPETVLRTVGGRMAEDTVLMSNRLHPEVLLNTGFHFKDTDLRATLQREIYGETPLGDL